MAKILVKGDVIFELTDQHSYSDLLPNAALVLVDKIIAIYNYVKPTHKLFIDTELVGGYTNSREIYVGLQGGKDKAIQALLHELGHSITFTLVGNQKSMAEYATQLAFLKFMEEEGISKEQGMNYYYSLPAEKLADDAAKILLRDLKREKIIGEEFEYKW